MLFTYAPFMHFLFESRPLSIADGLVTVSTGIAILFALELEKLCRLHLFATLNRSRS